MAQEYKQVPCTVGVMASDSLYAFLVPKAEANVSNFKIETYNKIKSKQIFSKKAKLIIRWNLRDFPYFETQKVDVCYSAEETKPFLYS